MWAFQSHETWPSCLGNQAHKPRQETTYGHAFLSPFQMPPKHLKTFDILNDFSIQQLSLQRFNFPHIIIYKNKKLLCYVMRNSQKIHVDAM